MSLKIGKKKNGQGLPVAQLEGLGVQNADMRLGLQRNESTEVNSWGPGAGVDVQCHLSGTWGSRKEEGAGGARWGEEQ